MSKLAISVDVIIPIYNASVLTKRWSVITWLDQFIRYGHIRNDASDTEPRSMPDGLSNNQVYVHSALVNQGLGTSVNQAVVRPGCKACPDHLL